MFPNLFCDTDLRIFAHSDLWDQEDIYSTSIAFPFLSVLLSFRLALSSRLCLQVSSFFKKQWVFFFLISCIPLVSTSTSSFIPTNLDVSHLTYLLSSLFLQSLAYQTSQPSKARCTSNQACPEKLNPPTSLSFPTCDSLFCVLYFLPLFKLET